MPAAIRIDLCSTAEVAPGNALKVNKAGLMLAVFKLARTRAEVQDEIRKSQFNRVRSKLARKRRQKKGGKPPPRLTVV